jgi:hypothetical protein
LGHRAIVEPGHAVLFGSQFCAAAPSQKHWPYEGGSRDTAKVAPRYSLCLSASREPLPTPGRSGRKQSPCPGQAQALRVSGGRSARQQSE